jgi:WD40 repeat protein
VANPEPTPSREEQVNALLAAYLEAERAGNAPAHEELLRRHPEFAAELQSFFADRAHFQQLAGSPPTVSVPPASDAPGDLARGPTPPASALPTVRYFGDYELLEEIARGGCGVVYKARQVSLDRTVALKMILSGSLADADEVRRFYTEAQAAANLQHPNIVPTYEVGQHEGQHYFAMEFVAGQSLAQLLRDHPLPPAEAARHVETVARAIHYAHEKGTLHRDLKPPNILMDPLGQPHVTDFGLAKRVGEQGQTATGAILGTASYMPPEQAAGNLKAITAASDVYSLGAVLYECLTGRPPFQGPTMVDTLKQVLGSEPVPPRRLQPSVPRDLETICLKCLDKNPARRYGTAADLADDLERWRNGLPITARPVGKWERVAKWMRRKPALAAVLAMVVVLILTVTVGMTWTYGVVLDERNLARAEKKRADDNADKVQTHAAAVQTKSDEILKLNNQLTALLYGANMNLARASWDEGNVQQVLALLQAGAPQPGARDLRGFEWKDLHRLCYCNKLRLPIDGEVDPLGLDLCLCDSDLFSPDGQYLAVARTVTQKKGNNWVTTQPLQVWDTRTAKQVLHLESTKASSYWTRTFSPDGKRLAVVGAEGILQVWDLTTGKKLTAAKLAPGEAPNIHQLVYSPDGKWIALRSRDQVTLWDAHTGTKCKSFTDDWGQKIGGLSLQSVVFFSADSKVLQTMSHAWRIADGKQVRHIEYKKMKLEDSGAWIYFQMVAGHTPDGSSLFAVTSKGEIQVFDASTGKLQRSWKDDDYDGVNLYVPFSISPDSHLLATAASKAKRIKIWNLATGQLLRVLTGHEYRIECLQFGRDGKKLFSLDEDGVVKTWDADMPPDHRDLGFSDAYCVGWQLSPDGGHLAVARREGVNKSAEMWDTHTGQRLYKLPADESRTPIFSAGAKFFVHAGQVWETKTGKAVFTWKPGPNDDKLSAPLAVADDGRLLVVQAPASKSVKILDIKTGQECSRISLEPEALSIQAWLSLDGKRIALHRGPNFSLLIFDTQTGQEIRTIKLQPEDHTIGIFLLANLEFFAFSPDGAQVAMPGQPDTVCIWDVATGELLCKLPDTGNRITCAAFSPDGKRIASGTADKSVKLWDTATGKQVFSLPTNGADALAFSPDGQQLTAFRHGAGNDSTIRIWDATPQE